MQKRRSKILAIDPGTREMGIAFLEGQDLVYRQVKTFKYRATPHENLQEARLELLRLFRYLRPETLAIEKTFFSRSRNTALLNVLVDEIKALAKRHGITVKAYAPNTVKKFISGNGHATKDEVARAVVERYPELRVYLSQNRKWKSNHHANMFDAIAIGLLALDSSSR